MKSAKPAVQITIFSDNIGKRLHKSEFNDFSKEYPNLHINLKTTGGTYHDRYIIVDFGTENETIYHCGGSSKDAGVRTTAISQVEDKALYQKVVADLQGKQNLVL